jgi:phosphoglycerate dehydrogenase-like enzyme
MPISFNINIANTDVVIDCVNTLIAGILNAATMEEAQVLLDESDVLIHSLPYNKRGELATKRIQAQFKAYPRLEALRARQLEARRAKRSKKTNDAINRANELIASMYSATTKEQLTEFLNESSIIINNLPSDEQEKEELINRQWTTWGRAYTRLSPPIHRRG